MQKRVRRAVERLREFFAKRGITVGASGLAVVISANAAQAAPVGLALTISTAAALTGATPATTATVTATKAIAMTALRKTIVTATIAVLAGVGIYKTRQASTLRTQVETLQQQQAPLEAQIHQLQHERNDLTNQFLALRRDNDRLNRNTLELLRLRSEVGELRKQRENLKSALALPNALGSQSATATNETSSAAAIPKESWTFSGYATPEAALQSVVWAMSRGDVKTFLDSLTPEAREQMEPELNGKDPAELEANLRAEASAIGALRLDWKRDASADEVSFVVLTKQEDNGATRTKDDAVLKFKNVGGIWKYAP